MNKQVGFKIRKLREAQLLSQETMANKLGISQGALCKIESGFVEKVDFALIKKICDLFDVDLQYFFEDSSSQYNKDNKNSAISIFGNTTVNNHYPEAILFEIQNLIEENKQLKAKIAELEKQ
jgi:transcriptional regulator with XRE-family HTH domain